MVFEINGGEFDLMLFHNHCCSNEGIRMFNKQGKHLVWARFGEDVAWR